MWESSPSDLVSASIFICAKVFILFLYSSSYPSLVQPDVRNPFGALPSHPSPAVVIRLNLACPPTPVNPLPSPRFIPPKLMDAAVSGCRKCDEFGGHRTKIKGKQASPDL